MYSTTCTNISSSPSITMRRTQNQRLQTEAYYHPPGLLKSQSRLILKSTPSRSHLPPHYLYPYLFILLCNASI
jgi:hypothetical protein